jgi:hypothetical protein
MAQAVSTGKRAVRTGYRGYHAERLRRIVLKRFAPRAFGEDISRKMKAGRGTFHSSS